MNPRNVNWLLSSSIIIKICKKFVNGMGLTLKETRFLWNQFQLQNSIVSWSIIDLSTMMKMRKMNALKTQNVNEENVIIIKLLM